jgi:putative addiction module component (TIGR02574 family)
MTKAEQIAAQALRLPARSRAKLASALMDSLDDLGTDPQASALWDKEIARRVKLDDQGKLKYISMEESLRRLR